MWRGPGTGRIKAIAFNPQNPSIVYVASAGGGIWKSTNGGTAYIPLTDNQPSQAFQSLVVDPTNPNTLYAGTGEIGGLYGLGILKSTDGGANWTLLGRDLLEGLVVSAIIVHPTQPNIVYAAAANAAHGSTRGLPRERRSVLRSTDGGASWASLAHCDDCYGFSDLVMEDANPQVLYAALGEHGIFKTTDAGVSWAKLTNGLPERGFRRIELGIGRGSGSGVIYAGYDARVSVQGQLKAWGSFTGAATTAPPGRNLSKRRTIAAASAGTTTSSPSTPPTPTRSSSAATSSIRHPTPKPMAGCWPRPMAAPVGSI